LKKVLSSSFIFNDKETIFEILHQSEKMSDQECKGPLNPSSFQHLREMRHLQLRKQHQGKILHCNGCQKLWNTTEVINKVIQHLFHKSVQEHPDFWPDTITFPLKEEEIELIALRYQYDLQDIPESATHLRQLLQLIVLIFF
jgi:uncharacterized Rmd1/YagE family protein